MTVCVQAHGGLGRFQQTVIAHIMKRCLSGIALRRVKKKASKGFRQLSVLEYFWERTTGF